MTFIFQKTISNRSFCFYLFIVLIALWEGMAKPVSKESLKEISWGSWERSQVKVSFVKSPAWERPLNTCWVGPFLGWWQGSRRWHTKTSLPLGRITYSFLQWGQLSKANAQGYLAPGNGVFNVSVGNPWRIEMEKTI